MNLLTKGNIFTQIRQYFTKPKLEDPQDQPEQKEKVKLEEEDSGIKYGLDNSGRIFTI